MVVIMELTDKWVAIHLDTLYRCVKFYKTFPEIVASLRRQSRTLLSWTHYRILLQIEDKEARNWYEKRKLLNKRGVFVFCKETFLHNIIIVCFIRKKRNL